MEMQGTGRWQQGGRVLLLSALVTLCGIHVVSAQRWEWPKKAENLKVLPEDTTPEQLRAAMFGFTRALGVRCSYCHDDRKGDRLDEMDFASDFKEDKDIARIMMKMVQSINGESLTEIKQPDDEKMRVMCVTCHRGNARPIMLEDELAEVIEKDGVQAAITRYHELREKYKNGFTYDFSEPVLNGLGRRLMGEGKVDDALALFKLNAEMYPESGNVYASLAEVYKARGEKERALALYQRALGLDPDNDNIVRMLKQLQGEAPGGQ